MDASSAAASSRRRRRSARVSRGGSACSGAGPARRPALSGCRPDVGGAAGAGAAGGGGGGAGACGAGGTTGDEEASSRGGVSLRRPNRDSFFGRGGGSAFSRFSRWAGTAPVGSRSADAVGGIVGGAAGRDEDRPVGDVSSLSHESVIESLGHSTFRVVSSGSYAWLPVVVIGSYVRLPVVVIGSYERLPVVVIGS